MAVEGRLAALIGAPAGKLHTARSRNDQVNTDVRLWTRAQLDGLDADLSALIGALLDLCARSGQTLVPGYTHLQRGQPVWLGHVILAHAWALSRDRERVADARRRVNRSPLGAAAMAGSAKGSTKAPGFRNVQVQNSVCRSHLREKPSNAAT